MPMAERADRTNRVLVIDEDIVILGNINPWQIGDSGKPLEARRSVL
jgi:hypothetical protein